MKLYSLIGLFLLAVLLCGCVNPVSKSWKEDEDVQEKIQKLIVSKGEDMYNLELAPNVEDMKFERANGLPWPDSSKLTVPVKTIGNPEFSFTANLTVDARKELDDSIEEIDIFGSPYGLGHFGNFLMAHMFKEKFKNEIKEILDYDTGVYLDRVYIFSKTSVFIENVEERNELMRAISADYNAGKFDNFNEYSNLEETYFLNNGSENLPEIFITIDQTSDSATTEEKFNNIILFIKGNKNLPRGKYHIKTIYSNKDVATFSGIFEIKNPE